jgi:hypothetical protein
MGLRKPPHDLRYTSVHFSRPYRSVKGVTLHIERRGFLHFVWRYRMEVHGSLSQLTLPKMNAEVSVRA